MNFITKYYEFINLYNLLIKNLKTKNDVFNIDIYHLNNEFTINIKSTSSGEIVFNYHFETNLAEFNYLVASIGNEFIDNHKINLPFFDNISQKDAKLYYQSFDSNTIPFEHTLNYDEAKVHILRNSKFELRIYYFKGLTNESFKMQDKALQKLNRKR